MLARLQVPQPWRGNITTGVQLIDELEGQIAAINRKLRAGREVGAIFTVRDAKIVRYVLTDSRDALEARQTAGVARSSSALEGRDPDQLVVLAVELELLLVEPR